MILDNQSWGQLMSGKEKNKKKMFQAWARNLDLDST